MKVRILFTGNGNLVLDDLMRNLPAGYQAEKCPPAEGAFLEAMNRFNPHTLVVCLAGESRDMLRMYSVLQENKDHEDIVLAVVGNDEDCNAFKNYMFLKNMLVFVRPLDRDYFMDQLDQFCKEKVTKVLEKEAALAKEAAQKQEAAKKQAEAKASEKALIEKIDTLTRLQGRKHVLVVDDDVLMLNMIKLYLQDMYDVTVVPTGRLALKFLEKKQADIVLLDYMMPIEDGPEVLRQLRTTSPQKNIPVLFLTGVADKEMVVRSLEFRPNGYMLKPVTRQDLLERVTEVLLGL